MTNAKELRIGNLVLTPHGILPVRKILENFMTYLDRTGYPQECSYSHIKPVPLTPELLEKCLGNKNWVEVKRNVFVGFNKLTDDIYLQMEAKGVQPLYCPLPHIKHLHQLQNLIYILSGNELNVEI